MFHLCSVIFYILVNNHFYFAKLAQAVLARALFQLVSKFFSDFLGAVAPIQKLQAQGLKICWTSLAVAHLILVCFSLARKISINNLKTKVMNTMNNFTISGFVVNDAEVKNFENASIARFGLSVRTTEKKGNENIQHSSILNLETWVKNNDATILNMLKKGSLVKVQGFFKADSYTKDNKVVNVIKFVATKIETINKEAKEA